MEYVMIEDIVYPIDTPEEIAEAQSAMKAVGLESLPVSYTPNTYDWVVENGDPDGYGITMTLFAD